MKIVDQLAESRIQEAIDRGELDELAGAGKPLPLDDDALVPEELRMAYRILKNANYLPPELQLRKDIEGIEDLLHGVNESEMDDINRHEAQRRLTALRMQLELHRGRGGAAPLWADPRHHRRLLQKLQREDDPSSERDA